MDYSKLHFPCGHWHKRPVSIATVGGYPDVYIEMYNISLWQPVSANYYADDTIPEEMFRILDTTDFDGNATYWWEVTGYNSNSQYGTAEEYTVYLVDTDGTEYASITLPAQYPDATSQNMARQRVQFTPPVGSTTFAVKFPSFTSTARTTPIGLGAEPAFGAIRIIVQQDVTATKTMVQIPLQCLGDWGSVYSPLRRTLEDYYTWEKEGYSARLTPTHYKTTYDTISPVDGIDWDWSAYAGIWKYDASELSTISKAVVEAAAGSPDSLDSIYIALFDKTTDTMVSGTEQVWGPGVAVSRKRIEFDPTELVSGHEYELRYKVPDSGGTGCEFSYEGNLYLWLNPIGNMTVWQRVGKSEYCDYFGRTEYPYLADESRVLLNLPANCKVYFENTAFFYSGGSMDPEFPWYYSLWDGDSNNWGLTGSNIELSELWWTETSPNEVMTRQRSAAISTLLMNGNEYVTNEANNWRELFQCQAFIVISSGIIRLT